MSKLTGEKGQMWTDRVRPLYLEISLEWGTIRICTRAYFMFGIHL